MELELVFAIALVIAIPLLAGVAVYKALIVNRIRREPVEIDRAVLESAERTLETAEKKDWVVLKRCHGPAYSHTAMTDIVGALTVEGVEAMYDVIGTSSADGGVTNYMLMVIRGKEAEALEILSRLEDV